MIKATNNFYFQKLHNKTQMIRNLDGDVLFTTRIIHSKDVSDTCETIINRKKLVDYVNKDRLFASALLHDIGHTPFGHAGEEEINKIFRSVDNSHYSERSPGIFRHNLNSIRLLGLSHKNFSEDDYVLVDSILKHSSLLNQTYNYYVYSDENILKANFIFQKIGFDKSKFLDIFCSSFTKKHCRRRSKKPVFNRKICYACLERKTCFYSKQAIDQRHQLSMYLSYPFPLTIEGTILYWADEISCFCSDLKDLLIYLHKYEQNIPLLISLNVLKGEMQLLKSQYNKSCLLNYLETYIGLVENTALSFDEKAKQCNELLNNLKEFLISSLKTNHISKQPIHLRFKNNMCCLRFELDNKTLGIWKRIKDAIYKDIHRIPYIESTNNAGKDKISSLLNHYSSNFHAFLEDCCSINGFSTIDFSKELAEAIFNLLSVKQTDLTKLKKEKYIVRLGCVIRKKSFSINESSLSSIPIISENIKDNRRDYTRVSNLFKREIGYFIATLSEKQLLRIEKNRGLSANTKQLPTAYF